MVAFACPQPCLARNSVAYERTGVRGIGEILREVLGRYEIAAEFGGRLPSVAADGRQESLAVEAQA